MRTQAHARLDIGNVEAGFVVAHGSVFCGEIHRYAFDARHFTDPLFHLFHTQHRQHGVHFDNACFHIDSFVGFMHEGLPVL